MEPTVEKKKIKVAIPGMLNVSGVSNNQKIGFNYRPGNHNAHHNKYIPD